MRAQPYEDEEEDKTEGDESRNLLLPSAGVASHHGGVGSGIGTSTKRTGLLWTAAPAGAPSSSGGTAAAAADSSASIASRLFLPSSFVLDLSMLVRVFFYRGLFVGQRWLFPLLLATSAVAYEVAASTILNVIGEFYLAISSMNTPLFLQASGGVVVWFAVDWCALLVPFTFTGDGPLYACKCILL